MARLTPQALGGASLKVVRSVALAQDLCDVIPGGVNSPFRGFGHVACAEAVAPMLVLASAQGAHVTDVDGNSYLDFVGAWGPAILGHAHPEVRQAAIAAIEHASVLGASTEVELTYARELRAAYPSMEMLRFVNSGAEAVTSALRLARAATLKSGVVKMEGGYHGHVEALDMADPTEQSRDLPRLSGAAPELVALTRVIRHNDIAALADVLQRESERIAAVIVEPVTGSMGVIEPEPGYLQALRDLTRQHDVLLIFDEVLCGLRIARGGAAERYGVHPDITVLGKILGGGFPAGAYGAGRAVMSRVAPVGPMYQAGTFSGNPVSMAAGLATLRLLAREGVYEHLERLTARLCAGIAEAARQLGLPLQAPHCGSMFSLLFSDRPVASFDDFKRCDDARFARFFHGLLRRGIYLPPSQSDAAVVSLAHTEHDIEQAIDAASQVLTELARTC
jgi:glutamate-1-semialdehyde 2,1-aminomutase